MLRDLIKKGKLLSSENITPLTPSNMSIYCMYSFGRILRRRHFAFVSIISKYSLKYIQCAFKVNIQEVWAESASFFKCKYFCSANLILQKFQCQVDKIFLGFCRSSILIEIRSKHELWANIHEHLSKIPVFKDPWISVTVEFYFVSSPRKYFLIDFFAAQLQRVKICFWHTVYKFNTFSRPVILYLWG
jgi:hypothetical protein